MGSSVSSLQHRMCRWGITA